MAIKRKRRKKAKKKLSTAEKRQIQTQRKHRAMARSVFRNSGFSRIKSISGKEFTVGIHTFEFDDVYFYENILVCLEYTTSSSQNVATHLLKKDSAYRYFLKHKSEFVNKLDAMASEENESIFSRYTEDEISPVFVYCSLNDVSGDTKEKITTPRYLDYPQLRYFENLVKTIGKSALHELIDFLKIPPTELGSDGHINISETTASYRGSVLPEASSNYPKGFKVVSFYADPASILRRGFVLRKDGWRASENLYQRLISRNKIEKIRAYLKSEQRVFVNNIIVTLPADTKIKDGNGAIIEPSKISTTRPATIELPDRTNSIGLIDGQHRTYAYYESLIDDVKIADLRKKQNLLITGIIYPEKYTDRQKEKFEARLFLEINSNQTNARSDLKQAIGLVLNPFATESIATRILTELAKGTGPLGGKIKRYFFETDKLRTTSIVSYGLKPLVKPSGNDSLFHSWGELRKFKMIEEQDDDLLEEYISFCATEINKLLSAFKEVLGSENWVINKKDPSALLTTTNINCFLICLRLVIQHKKGSSFQYYKNKLSVLRPSDIKGSHSSQYNRMAEKIFAKCFT